MPENKSDSAYGRFSAHKHFSCQLSRSSGSLCMFHFGSCRRFGDKVRRNATCKPCQTASFGVSRQSEGTGVLVLHLSGKTTYQALTFRDAAAFGVGCESMPPHSHFAILLIAAVTLVLGMESFSSDGEQRLIPTAEVISQKYCPGDTDLFRVDITLHLKFENHTDKALILDKQFGKFPSTQLIAKNRESLAQRDYEENPIFESFVDSDPPHFKPSIHVLHADFVLLSPGQSFERVTTVEAFARYVNKSGRPGPLNDGDHLLQIGFLGWTYAAKASPFEEAWRKFGQLVTEEIYTEPIPFEIPKNPQIGKACN